MVLNRHHVEFGLTMILLAPDVYRLFVLDSERYVDISDERIYENFMANNGTVEITDNNIQIELKETGDLTQTAALMTK